MQFTCCTKCSFIVNYCNKVSSRIVLTSKGFSVFFWITLSHEVSRHFPHTHTHPYQHMRTLRRFYIFAVHWRIYPFIMQNCLAVLGKEITDTIVQIILSLLCLHVCDGCVSVNLITIVKVENKFIKN